MNRFFYFMAGCMIVVGLLISGCRKDTWDDENIPLSTHAVFMGYHPVFDTIPTGINGFSGNQDAQTLAPTAAQIAEMKISFDNIPYGSPLSLKIGQISERGQVIDINHSMIQRSDDPDRYVISMPFIRNGAVESMIYYYHTDPGTGTFLLVEKQEVIQEIQNKCSTVSTNLPLFAMIAGIFNTTQLKLDSTYNSTINNWLSQYLENRHETGNIVSRDIIIICDYVYYATPLAQMDCGCDVVQISASYDCYSFGGGGGIFHDFGDPSFATGGQPKGGKSDGDGSGGSSDDGPILIGECWNNLSQQAHDAIIDVMESYYSPCPDQQAAVDKAIQDVLSDICAEINENGKILGIGYEALNLDKSTVTHRVMNKLNDKIDESLDGMDIIRLYNLDARTKCIYAKIMQSDNQIICTQLKRFEKSNNGKLNLQFSIADKDGNKNYSKRAVTNFKNWVTYHQIDIQFNPYFLEESCDLFITKTFFYEIIHANIYAMYVSKEMGLNIETYYPGIKEYFYKYKYDADHEYMGDKMIGDIVQFLKEIYGSQYTDEEYEALAWVGLEDTDAYKNKYTPAKRSKREQILDNLETKCKENNKC